MSSSQSLLGLVTQLQSMEMNLTSVLMEAALKLASLTDASVFFLIETPEGRRFAGRHHLCDAYLRGCLCPLPDDKELEVDINVSSLREKSRPPMPDPANDRALASLPNVSSLPPSIRQSPSGRKRPSPSAASSSSPIKQLKTNSSRAGSVACSFFNAASPVLKREAVDVKSEAYEIDDEDSDIEEIFAVESEEAVGGVGAFDFEGAGRGAIAPNGLAVELAGASGMESVLNQSELESEIMSWVETWVQSNVKAVAVRSIADPAALSGERGGERRLLSSLCYDFGKDFAVKFRGGGNRRFAFRLFWAQFPNLHVHLGKDFDYGGRPRTLMVWCSAMVSTAVSRTNHRAAVLSRDRAMVKWVREDFVKSNRKFSPLSQISDPACLYDKNTIERKLMSSLCYEFGKEFVARFSALQLSRRTAFETFWACFENLHPYDDFICEFKEGQRNLKSMCNAVFSTAVSYTKRKVVAS